MIKKHHHRPGYENQHPAAPSGDRKPRHLTSATYPSYVRKPGKMYLIVKDRQAADRGNRLLGSRRSLAARSLRRPEHAFIAATF